MILVITTDTPPEHLGQLEILGVASTTVDIPQERPMFKSNRWTSVPFDHLDDLRSVAKRWTTQSGKPANLIYGLRISTTIHHDQLGTSGTAKPTLVVTMMGTVAHAHGL